MSSKAGPRAQGTDGTDFLHRQRIAAHYQESANNKFYLKFVFAAHFMLLIFMWAKVGSEVLARDFDIKIKFLRKLELPGAFPWEYMYCFSFFAIIFGLLAFPRNNVLWINRHYNAQFLFAILPISIGLASQIPEVIDYFVNENSLTPTFKGWFPMVFIWNIFFIIALQVHVGAMYLSYQLSAAWAPVKKND